MHISRKKKDLLWYYKRPELITNGLLQNPHKDQKKIYLNGKSTKEAEEIVSRLTFPDTGDVVLDLMAGTGTNIIAALKCGEGRRGIGIEINQVTCDKARANVTTFFSTNTGQSGSSIEARDPLEEEQEEETGETTTNQVF